MIPWPSSPQRVAEAIIDPNNALSAAGIVIETEA